MLSAYREGTLSPAEAHALERAALDDPFLADALEGMEEIAPADFSADLAGLMAQIDAHTQDNETKVIAMRPWWRSSWVAVAAMLLLASSVALWLLSPNGGLKQEIAMQEQAAPTQAKSEPESAPTEPQVADESETATANEIEVVPTPSQPAPPAPQPTEARAKEETAALAMEQSSEAEMESDMEVLVFEVEENLALAEPAPAMAEEVLADDYIIGQEMPEEYAAEDPTAGVASDAGGDISRREARRQRREEAEAKEAMDAAPAPLSEDTEAYADAAMDEAMVTNGFIAMAVDSVSLPLADSTETYQYAADAPAKNVGGLRAISGRITDEDGEPLPGVNVAVTGLNRGAATDIDGYFVVLVPFNAPSLTVSYIGYQSEIVDIEGTNRVELNLQEDIATLSEVVVVDHKLVRYQDAMKRAQAFGPVPTAGFESYYRFLINKVTLPPALQNMRNIGSVVIRFTVDQDGVPKDFEVVRTVGFGIENQLIQVISEGPLWNPAREKGYPVAKRIEFEFPVYK